MILLTFSVLFGTLPFIIFLILRRGLKRETHYIFPFLIVVFTASIYEFFCSILLKWNVKYWFVIYNFLVFFTLLYFFNKVLKEKFKVLFILFVFLFIIASIIFFQLFSFDDFIKISSYYKILQTSMILIFSVLWVKRIFTHMELSSLLESSTFYFISGLLLYYSGTIFLFLLSNLMFKMDKSTFQDYWILNIIFNLVLRTLLILGIWKGCKK